MRLATGEFIRRFLIRVLPDGFHRIRHYVLLAGVDIVPYLPGCRDGVDKVIQRGRQFARDMVRERLVSVARTRCFVPRPLGSSCVTVRGSHPLIGDIAALDGGKRHMRQVGRVNRWSAKATDLPTLHVVFHLSVSLHTPVCR